jgi:DNA-binding NtrC family response regulator
VKRRQTPYQTALREFKIVYWTRMLEECQGSVSEAARRAGCPRTWLHKKLDELGLRYLSRGRRYGLRPGSGAPVGTGQSWQPLLDSQ